MCERVELLPLIRQARDAFIEAGIDSADTDARILAAHILGIERSRLPTVDFMSAQDAEKYKDLVSQRAGRVPLQHLTGVTGFRYIELSVGPGVFVPRPETEQVAGWVISLLAATKADATVVDLCSGSGAIALSVAHELPRTRVWAVEKDPFAYEWARRNVQQQQHRGDTPVTLLCADATDANMLVELDGTVDVVVANPPYVPLGAKLPPEVADHDPPLALWGGEDGLQIVRQLVNRARDLLAPGGWLVIEHAEAQHTLLPDAVAVAGGFTDITDHADLAERSRFTVARRLSSVG